MTGRRSIQPKEDDPLDPLAMIIDDAVESAAEAADEAGADIRRTINGRAGLGAVFAAAMDTVADTEPGNIGMSVFDAAMRAAADAVAGSAIPSSYDRVRTSVQSIPDRIVWAAGRRAASDLFAEMSVRGRSVGGGRLLDRMRAAAVRAAKTRLERDDAASTVQAAAADTRKIASIASESVSEMVLKGAPVHAATVAVFEVAIRGIPPDDLADAVEEACDDLPEMARRHDELIVTLVMALAMMIADDAAYRRKYQTAVRRAEEISRNEAADRIVEEIVGNTFEAVYMALVAGAYASSDGSAFEYGYEEALAAAFGMDHDHSRRAAASGMAASDPPPGVDEEYKPWDGLDLPQNVADTMEWLFDDTGDPAQRKMFMNAMDVDYKSAVSSGQMTGIISLYAMAYRAGYEGAGAVIGEKPAGKRRRWR